MEKLPLRVLNQEDTSRYLPFEGLIPSMRRAFAEGCAAPTRHHHTMQRPDEADATLLLMPAWTNPEVSPAYCGVKVVNVFPGNIGRGKPGLTSSYILYDGRTGEQLLVLDGNTITSRRTAAVAALAADYLALQNASRLLIIGAGRVASLLADAYRTVRNLDRIQVWDINPDSAQSLCQKLVASGYNATVAMDLEEAVGESDIVSAATLATAPLIKGDWLTEGTHVDLIGAFTPTMREADDSAIVRSSVFIDTSDALMEAGDLVQPMKSGVFSEKSIRATLEDLCRERIRGRTSPDEITVFKTVGTALADLTAAKMAYEKYRLEGES
nr:ornithine cyclodeaminase family protein [Brucella intermedia]